MKLFLAPSMTALTFLVASLVHPISGEAQSGAEEIKYKPVVTAFEVDVYKHTRDATKNNGNIVVNALQLIGALLLSCNAAAGATEKEIKTLFKLDDSTSCLDLFGVLFKMYTTAPHRELEFDASDQEFNDVYFTANRAYVDKKISLHEKFVQNLVRNFNMTPLATDFAADPEAARQAINTWVSQITEGNIKEFLVQGSLTASNRLVVLNGDFLRFQWANVFDPAKTEKSGFTNADGTKSQVPFMSLGAKVGYKKFDAEKNIPAFQAVRLSSKWGTYSLSLLMPKDAKDFAALEHALTPELIDKAVGASMNRETIDIKIPKFTLNSATDFRSVLENMGVKQLFSKTADLSRMTNATIGVDAWNHHAMIEANEYGLKALSTSALVIRKTVMKIELQTFDHPFLFIIQIQPTGYITHMGRFIPRDTCSVEYAQTAMMAQKEDTCVTNETTFPTGGCWSAVYRLQSSVRAMAPRREDVAAETEKRDPDNGGHPQWTRLYFLAHSRRLCGEIVVVSSPSGPIMVVHLVGFGGH
ncbi:serpin I2-like [Paramacrobiotus metropolitanus]|uniref:serpin I2-like n=1 Tax=Paramacrobiotus metropolitanus TaxID=2943436 RepID=UPI00244626D0|nr:serpin I2-like [Paramacrobiotus metropolitanus]